MRHVRKQPSVRFPSLPVRGNNRQDSNAISRTQVAGKLGFFFGLQLQGKSPQMLQITTCGQLYTVQELSQTIDMKLGNPRYTRIALFWGDLDRRSLRSVHLPCGTQTPT